MFDELERQLETIKESPRFAMVGAPGVGKTEAALEIKSRTKLRERFPDGVLWATLGKGADPSLELVKWAEALGIDVERPDYRSIESIRASLADRLKFKRMMLFVDDAWSPKHLPAFDVGGRYCSFVLTTRQRNLFPPETIHHSFIVRSLEPENGLRLLEYFVRDSVSDESAATDRAVSIDGRSISPRLAEIVAKVNGHPLALILIGRKLQRASRSGIESELNETLSRLTHDLATGDTVESWDEGNPDATPRSLEAAISLTVDILPTDDRETFYLASVFPPLPATFSATQFHEVTGKPEKSLASLIGYGLVENAGRGRFAMYSVIAAYAGRHAAGDALIENLRSTARTAFVRYFCALASSPSLDRRQFADEYQNILTAMRAAADDKLSDDLFAALGMFERYVDRNGLYASDAIRSLFQSIETAAEPADLAKATATQIDRLSRILLIRADTYRKFGAYEQATRLLYRFEALRPGLDPAAAVLIGLRADEIWLQINQVLFRDVDAIVLRVMGVLSRLSQPERAQFSGVLRVLGEISTNRGLVLDAARRLDESLSLALSTQNPESLSGAYLAQGALAFVERDYGRAESLLAKGQAIAERENHLERIAAFLHMRSAAAHHGTPARLNESRKHIARAIRLLRPIGHQWYLCSIYSECGEYFRKTGRLRLATAALDAAVSVAQTIGAPDRQAFAMLSLARVEHDRGNVESAREKAGESYRMFAGIRHYMAGVLQGFVYGSSAELP